MKSFLLPVFTALMSTTFLVGCNTLGKKSSGDNASPTSECAHHKMQSLDKSYDLAIGTPVECIAINRINDPTTSSSRAIQFSLGGVGDTYWPRLFYVWSGKITPDLGVVYPNNPADGTLPGFYGISSFTITPPGSAKSPDFTKIEMSFGELAATTGQTTRGTITFYRGTTSMPISFSTTTTVENK